MPDRPNPDIQPVLHAAMTRVAAEGLRGLSLRPLAEQLGSTVSALTHRFGLKDELMAALIQAAADQDAAFFERWEGRIAALDVRDGALAAQVADAVLADLADAHALRTRFYCELLQGVVARPEIAAPMADWSARRQAFWRAAVERVGDAELAERLHAFATVEGAHGLAVGDVAAYRWLRRLCLIRLCGELIPADGTAELRQFEVFRDALGERLDDHALPVMTDWQANVAGHISALIIEEGADAVTHRAIAARAGLANSTLAYHFPRQEDLLRAGLSDIAGKVHRVVHPSPDAPAPAFELTSVELARSTFAIALTAGRMPVLRPVAADLRRRRGENYVIHLNREAGAKAFDALSAQAMSLTGMGRVMLDAVMAPTAQSPAFQFADRLKATALRGH